jgi:predicted lipoprotein with Yx(FWY)xxD motif
MPSRLIREGAGRRRRRAAITATAVAAVAVLALAGLAVAKSFTLKVNKGATVENATTSTTKHEAIITTAKGFAVYYLTGDTKAHPKCTKGNGCFGFWPPVTAASAKALSKAAGISGKLTAWSRDGFTQAVLAGHPLYTYAADSKKGVATGEGVVSFGGTWHAALPAGATKAVQGNGGLPQSY